MKRHFSGKQLLRMICLLFSVGMLFFGRLLEVSATGAAGDLITQEGGQTGISDTRTNINEPGASDSPEDLRELNVANNLTVTYQGGNGTIAGPIRILITLTMIGLAPFLLLMLTAFTRIIIVLHFTRTALNTQTAPPNQVIVGLALFLTFFIMSPIFTEINETALQPFDRGEITQEEAMEIGMEPLREFMYGQT